MMRKIALPLGKSTPCSCSCSLDVIRLTKELEMSQSAQKTAEEIAALAQLELATLRKEIQALRGTQSSSVPSFNPPAPAPMSGHAPTDSVLREMHEHVDTSHITGQNRCLSSGGDRCMVQTSMALQQGALQQGGNHAAVPVDIATKSEVLFNYILIISPFHPHASNWKLKRIRH